MKTNHALDWGKTAQEIEDQFQAGMIERDRYREAWSPSWLTKRPTTVATP